MYAPDVKLCDYNAGPSNPKRLRVTPTFNTLLKELSSKVSHDWEDIGVLLNLEQGELSAIKSDHQQSKKCFREMLKLWLKQVNPPPMWSTMIEALDILDHESLAGDLKKKYYY